jgi:hypothetical protein
MNMRGSRTLLGANIFLAAVLVLPSAGALAALSGASASKPASANDFQFGVIGHSFRNGPDAQVLKQAIKETNQAGLSFVVVNAIKADTESCSDKLYGQRKSILATSHHPLILSLAASDWSDCKNSLGRSIAIDRLNRLRELFFADAKSQGEREISQTRLSASTSFRSYGENAHWEHGSILFATINLPANNNHFRPEAGRNSEFEDRLVANRSWIKRLFTMAQRKKFSGLVLISDGDAGLLTSSQQRLASLNGKHDGFTETRRQIKALAKEFPGQLLLIDSQTGAAHDASTASAALGITWNGNLGHLSVIENWMEIQVHPNPARDDRMPIFSLKADG